MRWLTEPNLLLFTRTIRRLPILLWAILLRELKSNLTLAVLQVGDFSKYLIHPENRKRLSFLLRENGYQDRLPDGGWDYRKRRIAYQRQFEEPAADDVIPPEELQTSSHLSLQQIVIR